MASTRCPPLPQRQHDDPADSLDLLAVVGGNEVTNPFVLTEVSVQHAESGALAALSFTRLLTP
jgi:hypothetical protein